MKIKKIYFYLQDSSSLAIENLHSLNCNLLPTFRHFFIHSDAHLSHFRTNVSLVVRKIIRRKILTYLHTKLPNKLNNSHVSIPCCVATCNFGSLLCQFLSSAHCFRLTNHSLYILLLSSLLLLEFHTKIHTEKYIHF